VAAAIQVAAVVAVAIQVEVNPEAKGAVKNKTDLHPPMTLSS
jgi:hypothetical protein